MIAGTPSMITDLTGKVVLVTGAGSGIGAALATGFARYGAFVALHYHTSDQAAQDVVAAVRAEGGTVEPFTGNLAESGAAERLVGEVVDKFGRLDVLINNAGGLVRRAPIADADETLYDEVLDLNVRPVVAGARAAVAQFRRQGGGGSIISTGSIAARHGGGPGMALFAGAKAFVQNFTRNLAKETAKEGIRVNAVAPGVIDTAFHRRGSTPEMLETLRKSIPMGRLGDPSDCLGTYLFLASDALSGYVTGQVIEVNGGLLML